MISTAARFVSVLLFAGLCFPFALHSEEPSRLWRDATGMYQIQGKHVKQENGLVTIDRADGKRIEIARDRLSAEDQKYLDALVKANPVVAAPLPKGAVDMGPVVIVVTTEGEKQVALSGIVIGKRGADAYILVPNGYTNTEYSVVRPGQSLADKIPVTRYYYVINKFRPLSVFKGPADKLPAPADFSKLSPPAANQKVTLLGFDSKDLLAGGASAPARREATIAALNEFTPGNIQSLQVVAEGPSSTLYPIATDLQGKPVACFFHQLKWSNPTPPPMPIPPGTLRGFSAEAIASWAIEPQYAHVRATPISGDRERIEFEIEAIVFDPLERIQSAALDVKRMDNEAVLELVRTGERNRFSKQIADGSTAKLTRQEVPPPKILANTFDGKGVSMVGRVTIPNPGPLNGGYFFGVQLSYQAADGTTRYLRPERAHWGQVLLEEQRGTKPANLKIPGIDGLPFDGLRPKKDAKGG